ncbi:hypothetical protein ACA910_000154 [Epithemia clementina (nom. ined.)]
MVSALTGRLFSSGEYSSAGNNDGAATTLKRKSEAVDVSSTSRSSGYAADVDQVGESIPPYYVDLQTNQGESQSPTKGSETNIEERMTCDGDRITAFSFKRQKIVERDYLAQNAHAEIARGGLTVPIMQMNCPRLLPPLCGIDTSRVSLVKSCDFSFQGPELEAFRNNMAAKDVCMQSIVSLADACRAFYQIPSDQKPSTERADDQSSTSSVTDSAETDTGSGNDDDDDEAAKEKKCSYMTMCDALSLCKQPRIVVLSTFPYTVVHANAAYLHTTGLSSMRLLGQPLQDFIADKNWISFLNGKTKGSNDLKQMHRQVIKMRAGSQRGSPLQCFVVASPIGMAHDRITHFALGLEPSSCHPKVHVCDPEEPFTPALTISG